MHNNPPLKNQTDEYYIHILNISKFNNEETTTTLIQKQLSTAVL